MLPLDRACERVRERKYMANFVCDCVSPSKLVCVHVIVCGSVCAY